MYSNYVAWLHYLVHLGDRVKCVIHIIKYCSLTNYLYQVLWKYCVFKRPKPLPIITMASFLEVVKNLHIYAFFRSKCLHCC